MTDRATVTVPLDPTVLSALGALAQGDGRSPEDLAAEAISEYVEEQTREVRQIEEAVRRADSGGPFVDHERVAAWARSLGGNDPLPTPEP
jgi:predicted transcriptional regulator